MENKDLIALTFFAITTPLCVIACCLSRWVRDAAFFLMIALLPVVEKLSVNFDTHFWYRGTTRGFEFTCLDVLAIGVLISSILLPKRGFARWFWPMSLGWMLLFFIYACANVTFSNPKIYGLFELSKMIRGILFFLAAAMFVRSKRDLTILVLALCCTISFESMVALKQKIGGYLRVPGTLDDPNSLSMYLCTVSPIIVAAIHSTLPKIIRYFSSVAILAASGAILLTVSRAGIPIFALVIIGTTFMCMSWHITTQKVLGALFLPLIFSLMIFKSWHLIQERYTTDSLKQEYEDTSAFESRGYYLRLAQLIESEHFYGVGLNNWSYWVSKKYGIKVGPGFADYDELDYIPVKFRPNRTYAAPAHCLAALTVGELGVPGLILFGIVWLRWFKMGARFLWPRSPDAMQRIGVGIFFGTCGIFLQSITEWVYHQTQIFMTFNIMIGTLAALYWIRKENLKRQQFEWHEDFENEDEIIEYEPVREPMAVA